MLTTATQARLYYRRGEKLKVFPPNDATTGGMDIAALLADPTAIRLTCFRP
jgi:hypothetical protein